MTPTRTLVLALALMAPLPVLAALNPEAILASSDESLSRQGAEVPMKNDFYADAKPYFIQEAVKGDTLVWLRDLVNEGKGDYCEIDPC